MVLLAARVLPTIDGSPTYTEISLRYIDYVGDQHAVVSIIDGKATDAQLEFLVIQTVARSQASLHTLRITQVYAGEKSKDNAFTPPFSSVQDMIVYHAKDANHKSRRAYLPAPARPNFLPASDTPGSEPAQMGNWLNAWSTVWAGTFEGVSMRFTQRREINKKIDL